MSREQLQRGFDLCKQRLDFSALVRARIRIEARQKLLPLPKQLRDS
ncbi:hypothetical protein JIR23_24355 [Bradyrhizobium diazoefficiens]|nr:hypothetical protein [Bradyrhizobium diazoefficiens]QQN62670.1 hypothetical protein JIR23_24355 [Bradyrhizobium diazoefficiens]